MEMRNHEIRLKWRFYGCSRLDLRRKVGVSEIDVSSLSHRLRIVSLGLADCTKLSRAARAEQRHLLSPAFLLSLLPKNHDDTSQPFPEHRQGPKLSGSETDQRHAISL